jgi:outer membrane protein
MLKKIIFCSFLCFLFNSIALSNEKKLAYINLDLLISKSNPGQLLIKNLDELEKKNFYNFLSREKTLKKEEESIDQQKNILSDDELKKRVILLKKKINAYNEDKKKFIKDFKLKENKEILKFLNSVTPIIENFMNQESIDILFEKKNIFIAKTNFDITEKVIVLINNNFDNLNNE